MYEVCRDFWRQINQTSSSEQDCSGQCQSSFQVSSETLPGQLIPAFGLGKVAHSWYQNWPDKAEVLLAQF